MRLVLSAGIGAFFLAQAHAGEEPMTFTDDRDKASYAIGLNIGSNIKRGSYDVDLDALMRGIKDFLAGDIRMTQEEAQQAITSYQQTAQARLAEKNRAEGAAFLAANKEKEGVQSLTVPMPEGGTAELQYKILTEGSGPSPAPTNIVRVHYRGTFINGSEFDNSYRRGEPAQFPLNNVIRGWTEAVQRMKVGAKWQLFIPSDLAYGEGGRPGIEPNATLIFEVELLEIVDPQPTPATTASPRQVTSEIIEVQGTNIFYHRPQDVLTNSTPR